VRREVLYNILIEFGVPMKLVRLIEMCLNKIYCKVRIGVASQVVLSSIELVSSSVGQSVSQFSYVSFSIVYYFQW
jgi:hypothetical protein